MEAIRVQDIFGVSVEGLGGASLVQAGGAWFSSLGMCRICYVLSYAESSSHVLSLISLLRFWIRTPEVPASIREGFPKARSPFSDAEKITLIASVESYPTSNPNPGPSKHNPKSSAPEP